MGKQRDTVHRLVSTNVILMKAAICLKILCKRTENLSQFLMPCHALTEFSVADLAHDFAVVSVTFLPERKIEKCLVFRLKSSFVFIRGVLLGNWKVQIILQNVLLSLLKLFLPKKERERNDWEKYLCLYGCEFQQFKSD
jgi:hypothetical protein